MKSCGINTHFALSVSHHVPSVTFMDEKIGTFNLNIERFNAHPIFVLVKICTSIYKNYARLENIFVMSQIYRARLLNLV